MVDLLMCFYKLYSFMLQGYGYTQIYIHIRSVLQSERNVRVVSTVPLTSETNLATSHQRKRRHRISFWNRT